MTNLTARDLTVSDKAEVPDVEAFIAERRFHVNVDLSGHQETIAVGSVRALAAQYQEVIDERDAEIRDYIGTCGMLCRQKDDYRDELQTLKAALSASAIDAGIAAVKIQLNCLMGFRAGSSAGYLPFLNAEIGRLEQHLPQLQTLRDLIK